MNSPSPIFRHYISSPNQEETAMKHATSFAVTGILITAAIFLFGCATATQRISLPSDINTTPVNMARIFVVRPPAGGNVSTLIICNETSIGNLPIESYICWDQPPGVIVIGCICWGEYAALKKQFKPGITYYFLIDPCKMDSKGTKWFTEIDATMGAVLVGKMLPPKILYPTLPPPAPMSPASDTPAESDPDRAAPPPDSPAKGNRIKM